MKNKVSILFWFRKAPLRGQELAAAKAATPAGAPFVDEVLPTRKGTIVCRLTINGREKDFGTGEYVARGQWDTKASRALGTRAETQRTNRNLTKLKNDLYDIQADLERQNRPVTAEAVRRIYQSAGNSPLSMVGLYRAFLAERKPLVGLEISPATYEIAEVRSHKLEKFLASRKNADLRPEEFTYNYGDQFIHWLLISEGFRRNVANKYLQSIMQVLTWAVRREYIVKSPLQGYRLKMQAPDDITYLEQEELTTLSEMELAVSTLGRARDCFVLQCWTGLAYADLAALDVPACVETHNGRRLLRVRRAKSTTFKGYECVIPLLPEAERILAHYQDQVPVFGNQYYNRALKQIGMLCGIEGKVLTSHIGRKTAGVLFLNAGIPMEVVSKILGHSSVKQTEKVYAKILDKTVMNEVERVFGRGVPSPLPPTPGFATEAEEENGRVIPFRFGSNEQEGRAAL